MAKYLDGTGLSKAFKLIKGWVTDNFLSDVTWDSGTLKKTKAGTTSNVHQFATVATSGSYNDLSNKPTIPSGVSPYTSNPAMDGTASPGTSSLFARGDHVHPTDTSRAANTDFTGATSSSAGVHGLVPAPQSAYQFGLLEGTGNWVKLEFGVNGTNGLGLFDSDENLLASVPNATGGVAGAMSAADKTNLDSAVTKLSGIASGAEVNQNAFSNVKVGSTTVAADGKTDTLELVAGSNVTLTPDATNDKVTIAATDTDTHYTARLKAGDFDTTTNDDASAATGDLFLKIVENSSVSSYLEIFCVDDSLAIASISDGALVFAHTNSVTAGIIGSSSASSGRTIAIPYATYDAQGHITAKGTHTHTIGSLQASDVTSGTFAAARIPDLAASKITSGTFDIARIPITGTVTDGSTGLVTGDAVYDAIQSAIADTAGALVYKGTAGTASAISGTSYKKGWYWIASATFALTSGINVEPGDMIIAKQDKTSTFANDIDVVQTNIDTLTEAEVTALWNAA